MHIGIQLHAPEGFETLEKGHVYHLLANDIEGGRVVLVEFVERPMRKSKTAKRPKNRTPEPLTIPCFLRRESFERGLIESRICPVETQRELPPWLGELSSAQLIAFNKERKTGIKKHEDRIKAKINHLSNALNHVGEIVASVDPFAAINRFARSCEPSQNPTRFRTEFLTYLLFGRNRLALHYPIHKIGHWDRFEKTGQKFGAKSGVRGANHGFGSNDPEMIRKIDKGYRTFSGLGVHLADIYQKTATQIFGCKAVDNGFDGKKLVHPLGRPFPTQEQFDYRINQLYSLEERQRTKYGEVRARHSHSAPRGSFTDHVALLLERVELDGYFIDEVPEGFLENSQLPKTSVVRIRDTASGLLAGIGFSVGGERASAYRMALFSMAIDKVKFCSLFGFPIKHKEWPSIGLSPDAVTDRGPGITAGGRARSEDEQPVYAEGAPSYMGQSKAVIESSNPRSVNIEGPPSYVTTRMTIPQLAVREIVRTIKENSGRDISARLNNNAIIEGVPHTAIGLWNYLDERGRTCAIPTPFEDAVRNFLTRISVKATSRGVEFEGQPFDSPALRETGLHQKMVNKQILELDAYMLDVCVRHLWVEVGGELVQVDAQLAISDGENQLYVSVKELEEIHKLRNSGNRELLEHQVANIAHWHERFEEQTGLDFDQGTRRSGRPKRNSPESIEERRQIKTYLQGKG